MGGKKLGAGGSPHVRCGNGNLVQLQGLDIRHKNGAGVQVVKGHIKETLNLRGMEVHGHDPGYPSRSQHIGNQTGPYRHPGLVLAVLACQTEVGDHCGDVMRRSPLAGVNHQKELHQIISRGIGALNQKNIASAHRFVDDWLKFPIRKAQKR